MQRALRLAVKATGAVHPNPFVGAVIVKHGKIVGEGFHAQFGGPHAEILALDQAGKSARKATLYVTLEPCNHHGKTPPCTEAIIRHGVSRVVIAGKDPNPLVSGKGIDKLKEHGIQVTTGVLASQAEQINAPFFKFIQTGLPYVTLKSGMTLDGKIATASGDSQWITHDQARKDVHLLRSKVSAILTGIDTIIADDPLLTARKGEKTVFEPVRIVVDSLARIPLKSRILNSCDNRKTWIMVTDRAPKSSIRTIEKTGAWVKVLPSSEEGKVDLHALMRFLGQKGISHLLVEAGSSLNFAMLKAQLVDKLILYISPKIIGGKDSYPVFGGAGVDKLAGAIEPFGMKIRRMGADFKVEAYLNKR